MSRLDWDRDGQDWPNRGASRFVRAAGLDWHVQEEGEGPVVLLLHGTGSATHSWRGLWPHLRGRARLIAPDLPGHGFTSAQDDMDLPAMARATAGLVATLGVEPDLVIGHSAGAAIAARMVLDQAVAPRTLVSIGGALTPFPGAAAVLFPAAAKLLFLNPLVPQLFTWTAGLQGETGRFLTRSTGSHIDARGARLYERLFRSNGHVRATLGMMASWDLVPIQRDLPQLGVPLLLLHGERDRAVPYSTAEAVAALVPGARLVPLEGLGHLPHEEAPTVVMQALAPLIDALGGQNAAQAQHA
jgi:magnesium chelatase accessory protein